MNPFVLWNATLLSEFFSPAQEGEPVVLAVGPDELNDLSPALGGYQGLLQAVKAGPPWCSHAVGMVGWGAALIRQRSDESLRPQRYVDPSELLAYADPGLRMPTYLPLLAVTVAVFTAYGQGGFYEELRRALNLAPHWGPTQLEQVNRMWDDLKRWSEETGGRFGRFWCGVLGDHPHVGRLRAQGVFRSTDAERLARSFLEARLRPGQRLGTADASILLHAISDDRSLSLGLRKAAAQSEYAAVLTDRLGQLLQDWDGSVPARLANGDSSEAADHETTRSAAREVGLSLHLSNGELPWRVGWRVCAAEHDGRLEFSCGDQTWSACSNGHPEVPAFPLEGCGSSSILEDARHKGEVRIDMRVPPGDQAVSLLCQYASFRHRILRYLVYEAVFGCMLERDGLPAHGPAYLLVAPDNANFRTVCSHFGVALAECPGRGLPDGWYLWHIPDCSALGEEQRFALPDGLEACTQPHPLRLVGGVRVRRGGRILFLPYDLPRVEVDAPAGAEVRAEGLTLRVEEFAQRRADLTLAATSVRRLCIEISDYRRQRFTIEARHGGAVLGVVTLRLSGGEAGLGGRGGDAGLDPVGRTTSEEPYLSGFALRGANEARFPETRPIIPTMLGRKLRDDSFLQSLATLPESRFLDSLAQATPSWLSYGEARDRIRRYLDGAGRSDTAARILDDLRRRGMFEITTDPRGRWTGIAKVKPMIYRLPVTISGQEVWGIAGTLSLSHWEAIAQFGMARWRDDADDSTALPVIRLAGEVDIGAPLGFLISLLPATAIAAHSGSLAALRAELKSTGLEQLDPRAHVEYFNAMQAEWGVRDQPGELVLLRYTDPETNSHVLHSLRTRTRGADLYRHVVDERWGTWLAYDACVDWAEHKYPELQGLAPWPLHHEEGTGDVWLPARMRLPHVLERALVAASGAPPAKCRLTRVPNAAVGAIFGQDERGNLFGPFSVSYDSLLPEGSHYRLWLRYRWIPKTLASLVAERLGCRLLPLSHNMAVEAAG